MNHVQESRIAWENAVQAAKAGHRGLNIWPGDRYRVRIEDLPVLLEGWSASLIGRAWDMLTVSDDKELQRQVKVGRSYALAMAHTDPDGFYLVVER